MKKKILKIVVIIGLLGGMYGLYLFNMPHRNAKNVKSEFNLNASDLANQFIENLEKANSTYLSDDGDSKVGIIKGISCSIKPIQYTQKNSQSHTHYKKF